MSMSAVKLTQQFAKRVSAVVRRVEASDRTGGPGAGVVNRLSPQQLFAVRVTTDGGAAGSLSTTCSWTYTVESDAGFEYGTTMTPQRRRFPNMPYTATPAGTWGAGFFDKEGVFVLWDANELPETEDPCP